MITVKLGAYSEEECRLLLKAVEEAYFNLKCHPGFASCEHCGRSHVCNDLFYVVAYLSNEFANGFLHCRKNRTEK